MKRAYLGHEDPKAQRELRIGQILLMEKLEEGFLLILGGFVVLL